ncbi:hypothetical protein [Nocardia rhizosphaerae]|uniref:Uncharacterized protein n=1 Tax=Nocardia rhizosphaerae TaxID=1691571 RepID=A0ABV8L7D5_9NOCA
MAAVARVVTGDEHVADIVDQPGDLEFLVVGMVIAQQLRALPVVVENVDRVATAIGGIPRVRTRREQREQFRGRRGCAVGGPRLGRAVRCGAGG